MTPRPLSFLRLLGLAAILVLSASAALAADRQDAAPAADTASLLTKPKVFLDAPGFDQEPLRRDIGFAELVSSLEASDVHVIIGPAPQAPGPGGYLLRLTGRNAFKGDNNVLRHVPAPGESREDTVRGVAAMLRLGLVRYAAKTKAARLLSVDFLDKVKPTAVTDPWNFWVFSLSGNGFLLGESSYHSAYYFASITANRVTPEWKYRASATTSYGKDKYRIAGDSIISTTEYSEFTGLAVKSLGEHWSVGGFLDADSSTYSNIDRRLTIAPAVEFNPFPYSESTRRQLRFLYKLNLSLVKYREETIFNRTAENLLGQSLTVTLEFKQPWGTVSTSLEGRHYFHDLKKYRVELNSEISIRVWKGLSFNIDGGGSRIHDQLFLAKAGASLQDVLLQRRQLETNYDFHFSVGLSFTFGSTRSTVVNPRFGENQGGTRISIHT